MMVLLKSINVRFFNRFLVSTSLKLINSPKCNLTTSNLKIKKHQTSIITSTFFSKKSNYATEHKTSTKLEDVDKFRLIYEGPLGKKIRLLKFFSLSTATVSVVCAPLFVLYGKQSIPFIGKMLIGGTVFFMGVTTTIIMHWLTRVYVHRMYFDPDANMFIAETSGILGTLNKHKFNASDVIVPKIESAFSTFEARGNKFFIHTELKEAEQIMKYVQESNYEQL